MTILSLLRRPAARLAAPALMLLLAAPLAISGAEARAGGGSSFGSRGGRTFSMPPATQTAPSFAQPFQRSETPSFGSQAAQPRRFGLGTGLLAGLLGAGLFGSLFGGGFFAGIAGLIGLLVKLAIVGGIVWLVIRLVRGRFAGPVPAGGPRADRSTLDGGVPGGMGAGTGLGGGRAAPSRGTPATVDPQDYAAFEQSLGAVQEAYSREDIGALSRLATPEIVRDLAGEIEQTRARGLRNDVSQTRLVRGDLSEAWREGATTYATVAMRFAAIDVMVDRQSGRVASGDPVHPVEAVELWTFAKDARGGWLLSAIQQGG